jgi:predicted Rossmann fold nucleotide-binding protein DprA/Smf involved in DNA uptake
MTTESSLPLKMAVVGSRSFTDYSLLKASMDKYRESHSVAQIISGGAQGADSLAEKYAREHSIPIQVIRPDWSLGKGAGIVRNRQIVAQCDVVLAFWNGTSPGTKSTIDIAKRAGKSVVVVTV